MNPPVRHLVVSFLLLTSTLCVVAPSRAEEPEPLHRYADDRLPPPSARLNLMLTGAAMFGISYGAAVGASYLWPDSRGASDLRIPVAGPWMKVGRTRLCSNDPGAENCQDAARVIGAVIAAIDGLAQAGGLLLITQSIFMSASPLTETSSSLRFPGQPISLRLDTWGKREGVGYASAHNREFQLRAGVTSDAWMDAGLSFFGAF